MTTETEWDLDDTWDKLGIEISELQHVEVPAIDHPFIDRKHNTDALDAWISNQNKDKPILPVWVVLLIMIAIGVTLVSFMVAEAGATGAFMEMTITKVQDTYVVCVDDDGNKFSFYKDDDFEYAEGAKLTIYTDIVYQNNNTWKWVPEHTGIVNVK
jgi:hypothetical protein